MKLVLKQRKNQQGFLRNFKKKIKYMATPKRVYTRQYLGKAAFMDEKHGTIILVSLH